MSWKKGLWKSHKPLISLNNSLWYLNCSAFLAPQVGLEPTTLRLTAACSANWAIEEYRLYICLRDNAIERYLLSYLFRQLSTLPGSRPPSTIDVKELNFRVRYGNGWILLAIITGFSLLKAYTLKTKQCFLILSFSSSSFFLPFGWLLSILRKFLFTKFTMVKPSDY